MKSSRYASSCSSICSSRKQSSATKQPIHGFHSPAMSWHVRHCRFQCPEVLEGCTTMSKHAGCQVRQHHCHLYGGGHFHHSRMHGITCVCIYIVAGATPASMAVDNSSSMWPCGRVR
jgi:hypothetical protein